MKLAYVWQSSYLHKELVQVLVEKTTQLVLRSMAVKFLTLPFFFSVSREGAFHNLLETSDRLPYDNVVGLWLFKSEPEAIAFHCYRPVKVSKFRIIVHVVQFVLLTESVKLRQIHMIICVGLNALLQGRQHYINLSRSKW